MPPLAAETSAWHPTEEYAGQVDCIARHKDGSLAVIDWKSGSRLYPSHCWQAAAYALAVAELTGQPVGHAYVVKVPKTPPAGAPLCEADELRDIPRGIPDLQGRPGTLAPAPRPDMKKARRHRAKFHA